MNDINQKLSTPASRLAKSLAEEGFRVFTRKEVILEALKNGYSDSYAAQIIFYLRKAGWLEVIRPGLYALNPIFLGGHPIHEFEIASHIARDSVISHFSAMRYHSFTDQIPQITYATVKTGTVLPRQQNGEKLMIKGNEYHFTQIREGQFFGHKKIWVGESRVLITDPERTLLDGLIKPNLCGGLQEVLSSYKNNVQNMKVETLISYVLNLDKSIAKRLGWILDALGISETLLQVLLDIPFKGYILLDASGNNIGTYNKRWKIRENL